MVPRKGTAGEQDLEWKEKVQPESTAISRSNSQLVSLTGQELNIVHLISMFGTIGLIFEAGCVYDGDLLVVIGLSLSGTWYMLFLN